MHAIPPRHRSVAFIELDRERWACFLVTFQRGEKWCGYFAFRRGEGESAGEEVRTADIFLENSEAEVESKARGLGRPLLSGLLSSALHAAERDRDDSPWLRAWFREILAEGSLLAEESGDAGVATLPRRDISSLRSLYASYRLDQVAHFIALVAPADFQAAVDRILAGQLFDFGARDRLQFAMMVVEYIEARLPLPPFDVWLEDYLSAPARYHLYAHTLHREGRLP